MTRSFPVGHLVCFNSLLISLNIFIFVLIYIWQAHTDSNGELRFWRPLFYQLKLWALISKRALLLNFCLLMYCMFFTVRAEFLYFNFFFNILCFVLCIVLCTALSTFQSYYFSVCFCHIFQKSHVKSMGIDMELYVKTVIKASGKDILIKEEDYRIMRWYGRG